MFVCFNWKPPDMDFYVMKGIDTVLNDILTWTGVSNCPVAHWENTVKSFISKDQTQLSISKFIQVTRLKVKVVLIVCEICPQLTHPLGGTPPNPTLICRVPRREAIGPVFKVFGDFDLTQSTGGHCTTRPLSWCWCFWSDAHSGPWESLNEAHQWLLSLRYFCF